ncbi:unnamed protein product [Symbiodinium sp. CCMP2592]|nr:unnamed protein product [Symbiodinium sp. CCMP2592]
MGPTSLSDLQQMAAFGRLDAAKLAELLEPSVAQCIEQDAAWGEVWISLIRPQLRTVLTELVKEMQRDIESLLDLKQVVSSAFLRDKVLLGELFQKAGRKASLHASPLRCMCYSLNAVNLALLQPSMSCQSPPMESSFKSFAKAYKLWSVATYVREEKICLTAFLS